MTATTKNAVDEKIRESLESLKPGVLDSIDKPFDDLNMSSDLGLDSLDVINILFQLEETFAVKVPDDDDKLLIIGPLSTYIASNADPS